MLYLSIKLYMGSVMKAVIQRVLSAELKVDGNLISKIGKGYVIFLGVGVGDSFDNADYLIKKIPTLRICEDENGKINKSIKDFGGDILLVSQFTYMLIPRTAIVPTFYQQKSPIEQTSYISTLLKVLKKRGYPLNSAFSVQI